jgi:long-subunit acyl-CoA synthetase (AMP-forming)
MKRLGVWEEVPALPFEVVATEAPEVRPGDELVVVDPTDVAELAWLAGAEARGAAVNVGDESSTVLSDLREVQPTVVRARPAVWEALMAHVEARASGASALKQAAYRRLFLVKRRVRQAMGLGRVRVATSVGPLPDEVRAWFDRLGIEVQTVD